VQQLLKLENVDANSGGGLLGSALSAAASQKFETMNLNEQETSPTPVPVDHLQLLMTSQAPGEAAACALLDHGANIEARNQQGESRYT